MATAGVPAARQLQARSQGLMHRLLLSEVPSGTFQGGLAGHPGPPQLGQT